MDSYVALPDIKDVGEMVYGILYNEPNGTVISVNNKESVVVG